MSDEVLIPASSRTDNDIPYTVGELVVTGDHLDVCVEQRDYDNCRADCIRIDAIQWPLLRAELDKRFKVS